MNEIIAFTDGGVRGNGKAENIGAFALILEYKGKTKEFSEATKNTTNNIQELLGVIKALELIKTVNIPIKIHSDSAYVVNGINNWVKGWKQKGWKKSDGKTIENLELWKRLDELANKQQNLEVIKVKGHADNHGNNRADELVNQAMDNLA